MALGHQGVSRELLSADSGKPLSVKITFSISTLPKDADIEQLRATEASRQAHAGWDQMKPAPSVPERIEAMAGVAVDAVAAARPFAEVWGSLVTTLTVFTQVADQLGKVRDSTYVSMSSLLKLCLKQDPSICSDGVHHTISSTAGPNSLLCLESDCSCSFTRLSLLQNSAMTACTSY